MGIVLGIDFGGSSLSIFKKNEGLIFKEPAFLSVKKTENSYEVVALGTKAKEIRGKTTENTITFSPISEGVVKSVEYASLLLKYALNKVFKSLLFRNFQVVFAIPCGTLDEEKQNFEKIAKLNGIKKVKTIYSPICVANSQKNNSQNKAVLITDIGAEKTDIAVVRNNEIIKGATLGLGGRYIDNLILDKYSTEFNILFSENTAQKVKEEIGSLISNDKNFMDVVGIDLTSQTPRPITIKSNTIYPCIESIFEQIVRVAKSTLGECSPEILNEIIENKVLIVGSGAKITGADKYFQKHLKLECNIPENAETSVINGFRNLL